MEPLAVGHSLPMTRSNDDLPQPDGPEIRQPCPLDICGKIKWFARSQREQQQEQTRPQTMQSVNSNDVLKYLQTKISNKSDIGRIHDGDVGELCNVPQRVKGIDRTSAKTARTTGS